MTPSTTLAEPLLPVPEGQGHEEAGRPRPPLPELVAVEYSLATTTLARLEEIAQRSERGPELPEGLEELVRIETCHRVECYAWAKSTAAAEAWLERLGPDRAEARIRWGSTAVRHLFRVAIGAESLARGEAEVRQQIRRAAGRVASRHPRPVLAALFRSAVRFAEARTVPSAERPESVAQVAAERLRALARPGETAVLILGAGVVATQVAAELAGPFSVTVAYHRRPPIAGSLAGAAAVSLSEALARLDEFPILVAAAKHPLGPMLDRPDGAPRWPRLLIDLGMPRNLGPGWRADPRRTVVDLEELYRTHPPDAGGADEDRALQAAVDAAAAALERARREAWVSLLRRSAEAVRRRELTTAERYWGTLTREQRAAVERLTRRLVDRLVGPVGRRLRADPSVDPEEVLRGWDPGSPGP